MPMEIITSTTTTSRSTTRTTTTVTTSSSSLYSPPPTKAGDSFPESPSVLSPTLSLHEDGSAASVLGRTCLGRGKGKGRMSLSKRLERLGWQTMHETSVDKRQEVSLAPVFSLQQLRVARQQQHSVHEHVDTKARHAIDPSVVRLTYESTNQTTTRQFYRSSSSTVSGTWTSQTSHAGGRSGGGGAGGAGGTNDMSSRYPGTSHSTSRNVEENMVKEMDSLYVALSKARTRKHEALNRCGVFDDAVNELRARTQLRVSLKKNVNAAFDGGPIADLGQDDVGASTVLEAKLLELQGHLDSTSPTMRARASPSPSRSPDLRATASGGDNNDDDNCDFDDDAHEEDVRELLASISAKALKVAGNRSTEKSMLGETIATARATAMKLEEVQVQPELAEVRAMEIELATELNLNRYQDCIEERRAALFSTSGIDPEKDIDAELAEETGTFVGSELRRSMSLRHGSSVAGLNEEKANVRRLAYMRNLDHKGLVEAARKKLEAQNTMLAEYERREKARREVEEMEKQRTERNSEAATHSEHKHGGGGDVSNASLGASSDREVVTADDEDEGGEEGLPEPLDDEFHDVARGSRALVDVDGDGDNGTTSISSSLSSPSSSRELEDESDADDDEEDEEDVEDGVGVPSAMASKKKKKSKRCTRHEHPREKTQAELDAEERAALQRRRSTLAVTPLGMRRKMDALRLDTVVEASEAGNKNANVDGDGLLQNDPLETELRLNLQHSPSKFTVPQLPQLEFDEDIGGETEMFQQRLYRVWDMIELPTIDRVDYLMGYAASSDDFEDVILVAVEAWEAAAAAVVEYERLVQKRTAAHEDAAKVLERRKSSGTGAARRMSITARRMSVGTRRMSILNVGMLALHNKKLSLAESYDAIIATAKSHLLAALDDLEARANGTILKDGVDYRTLLRGSIDAQSDQSPQQPHHSQPPDADIAHNPTERGTASVPPTIRPLERDSSINSLASLVSIISPRSCA